MASYTVVIFVALAALGALIAYLGDLVGARLGKRRSTIFGMRPRRSARLIAAIVGAILPLIGLGVATLGSRYARVAVFELRTLMRSREELTGQIDDLQKQVARSEREARDADERATVAEREAETLLEAQEDAQERIGELTTRADDLRTRVDDLTARRGQLEGELEDAQAGLQDAQADLDTAQADLTTTDEDLERKRAEVEKMRGHVERLTTHIRSMDDRLAPLQRRLEDTQSELESRMSRLEVAQQELEDIEARLEQVQRRQELIAERPALFEPGDELIRVVLPADETQDQMESELYEVLHFAGAAAERRGVPEGANGRAVLVVAPIPPWASAEHVPEGMIVRHVASELRTRGADEWVVVVRAFRRLFSDDDTQLAVEFKAAANRLVFHAGEVLDEFAIGSDATALQAFEGIWLRITDKQTSLVRARAIAEGMLPHPDTGNYGSIDLAEIFAAAEAIRAGDDMMLVRVVAAEDTYTRGPLLLDIEVTEAEESP